MIDHVTMMSRYALWVTNPHVGGASLLSIFEHNTVLVDLSEAIKFFEIGEYSLLPNCHNKINFLSFILTNPN